MCLPLYVYIIVTSDTFYVMGSKKYSVFHCASSAKLPLTGFGQGTGEMGALED